MNHSGKSMTAILPFRRFNRNWYNAMAGAVLLGNSEIAAGSFVFKRGRGKYRVVCKELSYKFLLPCIGPARYTVEPEEDIDALFTLGKEFNILLNVSVSQIKRTPAERERVVGRCTAVFHASPVTPKTRRLRRHRNYSRGKYSTPT